MRPITICCTLTNKLGHPKSQINFSSFGSSNSSFVTATGYPAGHPVSGQPDIRQMKPDIRPDTGYQKRPDIRLAGYPVQPSDKI